MHEGKDPEEENVERGRPASDEASDLERLDVEAGAKIAAQRDHPAAKAAAEAGELADQGPLYAFSAGMLLAGIIGTRNRRAIYNGIAMLAAVGSADIAKRITKRLVRRTRPHVLLDEGRYDAEAGGTDEKKEQSFPSGHTACSVAAARALSRTYPAAGAVAGVAAIGVGVGRVAKGAHWPLDVAAGAAIGLAAEEVSARSLQALVPLILRWLAR